MIDKLEINTNTILRRISTDDAPALFGLVDRNRTHLRTWLPWLDANTSVQDSLDFINHAESQAGEQSGLVMLIEFDRKPVGVIGFNSINPLHRVCEIGYWLDKDHQGLGIMTRSAKRLVDFAFEDLALNKVCLPVATGNARSRAIPEKLGFTIEGISREAEWLYDRFVDHTVYTMLRSEWIGSASTSQSLK